MKFHCDQCSTKYSISDDRVRGKILKIRCKNCSEVITVRDPTSATSAKQASQISRKSSVAATLKADESSNNSSKSVAPETFEAEWYLSDDGEQEGPFDLADARDWVQAKPVDSELYCWSEGFDDWLPVEKVSHFRGLRLDDRVETEAETNAPTFDTPDLKPEPQPEPEPLFAATMAALSDGDEPATMQYDAEMASTAAGLSAPSYPVATEQSAVSSPVADTRNPDRVSGSSGALEQAADIEPNLDFEIGEASRIVDVRALMRQRGNAASLTPSGTPMPGAGLPGMDKGAVSPSTSPSVVHPIGRGTAPQAAIGGTASNPVLADRPPERRRRAGMLLPLLFGGFAILIVVGILIVMGLGDDETQSLTRGSGVGNQKLGYSTSGTPIIVRPTIPTAPPEIPVVDPKNTAVKIARTNPIKKNNGGTKVPSISPKDRNTDEVDLTGGTTQPLGPSGPLDGDDLMRAYRKNQIALKMCYERSLKKDPFLKVPKTWVDVKVSLAGKVTSVKISSLSGTDLGQCLSGRIRRWKFRTTSEVFSGRFLVVFN